MQKQTDFHSLKLISVPFLTGLVVENLVSPLVISSLLLIKMHLSSWHSYLRVIWQQGETPVSQDASMILVPLASNCLEIEILKGVKSLLLNPLASNCSRKSNLA